MDPITLAILAGVGAAKGIGTGVAHFQQAKGMMSSDEQELLKKLQRQQEMNALGYSGKEMSALQQTLLNPQQAMANAQADQLKAAMAAQDLGAADTFRQAMIQQEQQRQANAAAATEINKMNVAEAQRQQQQLLGLSNKQSQMEAAKKAAITEAITMGIAGAGEAYAQGQMFDEEMAMSSTKMKQQQEMMDAMIQFNQTMAPYLMGG